MKNRSEGELIRAYTVVHTSLVERGLRPILQKLDNEAPAGLKRFMKNAAIDYQLVPPHLHRRNAAERAIQTFKHHFIAGLASTDKNFPLHLWDRLLLQATTTLNLLRQSRLNPRLSAEAQLNGPFDFNRTPLAPPGTRVIVHSKPSVRRSWEPHGVDGWYVGQAPDHYRCYRVYIPSTRSERIADTVEFFPTKVTMPKTSSADRATFAALALVEALQHPAPAAPFASFGEAQIAALRQLATIFLTAAPKAPLPEMAPKQAPTASTPPPPRVTVPPNKTLPAPPPHPPAVPHVHFIEPDQETVPRRHPVLPPRVTPVHKAQPPPLVRHYTTRLTNTSRYPTRRPPTSRSHAVANHVGTLAGEPLLALTNQHVHHLANSVIDPITGTSQEYRHLIKGPHQAQWTKSFANELGRLAQGVGKRMPNGTNTFFFVPKDQIPSGRTVTYGRIVVEIRPQKEETHRTRLTVGGNLIDYPGDVSTPTADLTTTKVLINSTISTPGARFMTADVKKFYLGTPLDRFEYMRLALDILPEEIIVQYDLRTLATHGYVYLEIRKGMYGLPQAGILANQRLTKHLATFGYFPTAQTPGLWRHQTRPIAFSLVVDDFGVKYVGRAHAEHLLAALESLYQVTTDWQGQLYCGLTLRWDYQARTVELSMPGYIPAALHKFQHPALTRPQHSPHHWNRPNFGAPTQLAPLADSSNPLPPEGIQRLQQIIGTLLYYARAVDPTLLVALGTLGSAQSKGTIATAEATVQLLNYCATHPDACLRYCGSDMVLYIHSDASYLSEPQARSRSGGHFYLSDRPADPSKPPAKTPTPNGPLHTASVILRNVMASAAEAEVGALFVNAQEGTVIRTTLIELGHPQPPTPLQSDNSTATGIINSTLRQRRSKAIDMRFYWVRDRVKQGHFLVYWRPGIENLADYFTKHHPTSHHRLVRDTFLHPTTGARASLAGSGTHRSLRGCVVSSPTEARLLKAHNPIAQLPHITGAQKCASPVTAH